MSPSAWLLPGFIWIQKRALSGCLVPTRTLAWALSGGGFADDYYDYDQGKYQPAQSFFGHDVEGAVSIYHLFNPGARIPLFGILRVREHYSIYSRDDTSPDFVLPSDHSTIAWRAGLRYGGREPVLTPDAALELSAWYEGQYRTDAGPYGFNGDRVLRETFGIVLGHGRCWFTRSTIPTGSPLT